MRRFAACPPSLILLSAGIVALVATVLVSMGGIAAGRAQSPPGASDLVDLDGSGLPVIVKNGPSTLFERITVCYPAESMQPRWSPGLGAGHLDPSLVKAVDHATASGPCASVRLVTAGWPMRGVAMWSACSASEQEIRHGYTLLVRGSLGNLLIATVTVLLVPAALRWRRRDLQTRRIREGRCRECGYPIPMPTADMETTLASRTGLAPGAACPECGGA
jgi:hypothetical protein